MFAAAVDRNDRKPLLGQLLVRAGVLDTGSLGKALVEHERSGRPLGVTLVELGLVSEEVLVSTLGHQLGLPIARVAGWPVNPELRDLVPGELAEKHRCLPLALKGEGTRQSLYLAMADPSDLECLEAVRLATGREIRVVLTAPSEMDTALARHYRGAAPEARSRPGEQLPEQAPDDPAFLHHWSVGRDELLALLAPEPAPLRVPAPPVAARAQDAPVAAAAPGSLAPEARSHLDRCRLEELDAMVKLLMQLLVEGGVVSRDELVRRLSGLVHERR
jgi:hypothetical protein